MPTEDDAAPVTAWTLEAAYKPGGVVLMFAAPHSDNIPLQLSCRVGSGRIEIATLAYGDGRGRIRTLEFRSGDRVQKFRAVLDTSGGEETYPYAEARVRSDAPVLRAFAATGRLSELADEIYPRDAVSPDEREAVRRFFERCGAARS